MAGTTPPIPDSSGMLVRPKKPKKLRILDTMGGRHPGMAGAKPQIPGMFRPILPPGSEGQAVLGPAVGPTTPTKDVLQGAMLAMPIPDRVGDAQKQRLDWFNGWARKNRGRLERDPRYR